MTEMFSAKKRGGDCRPQLCCLMYYFPLNISELAMGRLIY